MLLKSKSSLFRLSFLADFYSKIFQNSNTQGVADPEEDEPESEEDVQE